MRVEAHERLLRTHTIIGHDTLSLVEKARRAGRAAILEMSPVWIKTMQELPVHVKLARSSEMFSAARDALVRQAIADGVANVDEVVAARLLASNEW